MMVVRIEACSGGLLAVKNCSCLAKQDKHISSSFIIQTVHLHAYSVIGQLCLSNLLCAISAVRGLT